MSDQDEPQTHLDDAVSRPGAADQVAPGEQFAPPAEPEAPRTYPTYTPSSSFEPAAYQPGEGYRPSAPLFTEPHAHVSPPYYTPGTAQNQPPFLPTQPPPPYAGGAYTTAQFPPRSDGTPPPPPGYGPTQPPYGESAPRRSRTRMALVGTAILAALIGGGAGAATVALTDNNSGSSSTGLSVSNATAQSTAKTDGSVASAAAKITPSVVTIQVQGTSESGTGSGVIIRSDGYILTNDHVVSVAASGGTMTVQTSDGRSAAATIVGRDTSDDLAVIKVSGLTNLSAATFARSSSAVVGQTVVAVGAPLGLSETVTSGIVSATARTVRSGDTDQAVFAAIQTDAAINPGNSGGALTDLNGNVLGINAAIASTTSSGVTIPGQQATQSGSIGIGFAIPSDEASRIAAQLIATGKSTHAALGVSVQSASSSSSATTTTAGATIAGVTAGGPAASAGLEAGDVVTSVDNIRITEADDLIAAIRAHAPQDQVTITYTRSGSSKTIKVTLTAEAS